MRMNDINGIPCAVSRDLNRHLDEMDRIDAREDAIEARIEELTQELSVSELYDECTPREWSIVLEAIKRIATRDVDNYEPDEPDGYEDDERCCRWR